MVTTQESVVTVVTADSMEVRKRLAVVFIGDKQAKTERGKASTPTAYQRPGNVLPNHQVKASTATH